MTASSPLAGPVLVTGSAGFIGGHVLRRLGAQAIGATRDGRGGTRRLDLTDPASMPAALAGIDAVVHCAVGNQAVTVDGTRALLEAAASSGVRRFVHLSSMAVYGEAEGRVGEDTPMVAAGQNDYAGWKADAERACLALGSLQIVRLRPTIVYGPGGAYWLDSIVRRIRSGRWGVFGAAADGTCNLVHVDDVADAIVAALDAPGAPGRAFNVNGPESVSWNAYFERLAQAMGQQKLQAVSPLALQLRLAASLPLKVLGKLRPGLADHWLQGVPGRSELGLLRRRATYPVDAALAGLGWAPRVRIGEGLARSLRT